MLYTKYERKRETERDMRPVTYTQFSTNETKSCLKFTTYNTSYQNSLRVTIYKRRTNKLFE